jgi:hypothetical protein
MNMAYVQNVQLVGYHDDVAMCHTLIQLIILNMFIGGVPGMHIDTCLTVRLTILTILSYCIVTQVGTSYA